MDNVDIERDRDTASMDLQKDRYGHGYEQGRERTMTGRGGKT